MKILKRVTIGVLAGTLCFAGTVAGVMGAVGIETKAEVSSTQSIDKNNPTLLNLNQQYTININSDVDGSYYYFQTDASTKPYKFEVVNDYTSYGDIALQCFEIGVESDKAFEILTNGGGWIRVNKNDNWIKTYENTFEPNKKYLLIIDYAGVGITYRDFKTQIKITHEGSSSTRTDAGNVREYNGKWTYFNAAGKPDYTFTGVAKNTSNKWMFIKNGVFDASYTGVAKNTSNTWVFVKKGYYYTKYTGVARTTAGKWIYVIKGKYSKDAKNSTGVAKSTSGNYVYVENGVFKKAYTGLAKSLASGNIVYVKKGKYYTRFNGRAVYEGKAYTVVKGRAVN